MRVILTGSRTWDRPDVIHNVLDIIAREAAAVGDEHLVVVHGCARGADMQADAWVRRGDHPLPVTAERHPADWRQGKQAGWVRNRAMVSLGADLCLGFVRDLSKGATGCVELAERAGLTVRVIDYDDVPGVV